MDNSHRKYYNQKKIKYQNYGFEAEMFHQYLLDNYSLLPIPISWSKEIIVKLDIGWSYKHKCFTFPHYNMNGNVIAVHLHKGYSIGDGSCKWHPLHFVKYYDSNKPLIISEGEKDVGTVLSYGKQTLCSTLGAFSVPNNLSPLKPFTDIVIVYDYDEAGVYGAKKMAQSIKRYYPNKIVRIAKW